MKVKISMVLDPDEKPVKMKVMDGEDKETILGGDDGVTSAVVDVPDDSYVGVMLESYKF